MAANGKVETPRYARAAGWRAARGMPLALAVVGALIWFNGVIGLIDRIERTHSSKNYAEYRANHHEGFHFEKGERIPSQNWSAKYLRKGAERNNFLGAKSRPYLAVQMMIGAAIAAAGVMLMRKRFSLRSLMLAVLAIGASGAFPAGSPQFTATIVLVDDAYPSFQPEEASEVDARLQPRRMLAPLTAEMRETLPPGKDCGILFFQTRVENGQLMCRLEVSDDSAWDRQQRLVQYYFFAFRFVTRELRPSREKSEVHCDILEWGSDWEAEWKNRVSR